MVEEKRLREIIREEINKYFSNKMLFEFYAYERSDFKDIVRQHLPQIIIQVCRLLFHLKMSYQPHHRLVWREQNLLED